MSYKLCLISLALAPMITCAAQACPQYDAVITAVQAGDAANATQLHEVIAVSAECDDALREWVGDYLARASFMKAMDASAPELRRASLMRALKFEKHWRSYAELGRLDWQLKDYSAAAKHLQLAINELSEGDQGHPAETSEIADIYQMASASLALADGVVTMPKTRSGTPGGVLKTAIRGFTIEEVNLPITFRYNSTEFDQAGETYAGVLAEHLTALGASSVVLGGHTDPVGGEAFNMDLSLARAEALSDYLKTNGFDGTIKVEGHGESQMPSPPAGVDEGSDEHHRIARRVAFSTE
ncbi:OmpA family protein [Litoreibacter sp.]|nr:OmpA family protein [Litoreibacter sp.]